MNHETRTIKNNQDSNTKHEPRTEDRPPGTKMGRGHNKAQEARNKRREVRGKGANNGNHNKTQKIRGKRREARGKGEDA